MWCNLIHFLNVPAQFDDSNKRLMSDVLLQAVRPYWEHDQSGLLHSRQMRELRSLCSLVVDDTMNVLLQDIF